MSENYKEMWESLGLDLTAHDALLEILGKGYRDIYLAQKNRPESMDYSWKPLLTAIYVEKSFS